MGTADLPYPTGAYCTWICQRRPWAVDEHLQAYKVTLAPCCCRLVQACNKRSLHRRCCTSVKTVLAAQSPAARLKLKATKSWSPKVSF